MIRRSALVLAVAGALVAQTRPQARPPKLEQPESLADTTLKAMVDEIVRSRSLALLEKPYFVDYQIEDAEILSASATMGALLSSSRNRFRVPQIQVRVGDYSFDNTNHVTSGFSTAGRDFGQCRWTNATTLSGVSCG